MPDPEDQRRRPSRPPSRRSGPDHVAGSRGGSQRGASQRQLRIIGGRWRGRRFRFPPREIRPTPDRVRETLFNWLATRVQGARCLDLYAGSGALGLEALSRGAASVVFVERDAPTAHALRELLEAWEARGASVLCGSAQRYLAGLGPPAEDSAAGLDLVFLDPPFDSAELQPVMDTLAGTRGLLAPGARIYVERAQARALPPLPAQWRELRAGRAGEVGYHLLQAGLDEDGGR